MIDIHETNIEFQRNHLNLLYGISVPALHIPGAQSLWNRCPHELHSP